MDKYPDSYKSENLPLSEISEWTKELYRLTYGTDMDTQPLCENCRRPLYYELNVRTGKIELGKCKVCEGGK